MWHDAHLKKAIKKYLINKVHWNIRLAFKEKQTLTGNIFLNGEWNSFGHKSVNCLASIPSRYYTRFHERWRRKAGEATQQQCNETWHWERCSSRIRIAVVRLPVWKQKECRPSVANPGEGKWLSTMGMWGCRLNSSKLRGVHSHVCWYGRLEIFEFSVQCKSARSGRFIMSGWAVVSRRQQMEADDCQR